MIPRVSIGMPVYNDREFLHYALDSLLGQSFTDFELIISDDGSTDGSEETCRAYATRDSRIRYVRQPQNLGISRNMEFLLGEARGEYFMWAGDDDVCHPAFVDTLVRALDDAPDAISAFVPMMFIDEEGAPVAGAPVRRSDYSGPTAFARVSTLIRAFDDGFGYGMFRREDIVGVQFPTWWWVNRSRAHNNIYPTLCYYLAKGDFVLVGHEPMHFKRRKTGASAHHVTPHADRPVRGLPAFLLWKVNLVAVSLRQIARAGKPLTALLVAPSMAIWWIAAATKRHFVRVVMPSLRRRRLVGV